MLSNHRLQIGLRNLSWARTILVDEHRLWNTWSVLLMWVIQKWPGLLTLKLYFSVAELWTISRLWSPSRQVWIHPLSGDWNEHGSKSINGQWHNLELARWRSIATKTSRNTGNWWPVWIRLVSHSLVCSSFPESFCCWYLIIISFHKVFFFQRSNSFRMEILTIYRAIWLIFAKDKKLRKLLTTSNGGRHSHSISNRYHLLLPTSKNSWISTEILEHQENGFGLLVLN